MFRFQVPQEQVQAELQDDMNEDEDDEQDDDEDIDENLFFGIPEQRSPDLATCTHCKGKSLLVSYSSHSEIVDTCIYSIYSFIQN